MTDQWQILETQKTPAREKKIKDVRDVLQTSNGTERVLLQINRTDKRATAETLLRNNPVLAYYFCCCMSCNTVAFYSFFLESWSFDL